VRAEIFGQLAVHRERDQAVSSVIATDIDRTEVSPWLELTRWSTYLRGHSLFDAARLEALPVAGSESLLEILCKSIDRLVDSAHRSVCEDRINALDQMRINSFLQRPRAADKPLMVKLQNSTYKRYSSIWKRLLCFVHRTMQPCQRLQLQHRLIPTQITHYDRMMMSAEVTLHGKLGSGDAFESAELSSLDYNCLQSCVSLLDHDLKASIFESSILGFLAVLGYSGILRKIASRSQNFTSGGEVALRKRIAMSIRSQPHACYQVETRRDATLVEMRREVRAMCDRDAASCYINPSEPLYIVFTQRREQGKK
jgi:hypothetical protein